MKVLINMPHLSLKGGVSNHYISLRPYWLFKVRYNEVGRRFGAPGFIILPYDYIKFMFLCWFGGYDLILLNPSLGKTALIRDAWFIRIARIFGKPVKVFFHGWNPEMVKRISKKPALFVGTYNRIDSFIVLSKGFKDDLIKWGINKPIKLTTTTFSDELLNAFDINQREKKITNLLFLTRIEEYKGIYVAIEAFKMVKNRYPELLFTVAGDGSELEKVKQQVKNEAIKGIEFLGYVSREEIAQVFDDADLYILPSHSEGMPTSVIEAMAFGLPVITRPVGGINDFFEHDKMGYIIDSLDPKDYADAIIKLIENTDKCAQIGEYNHNFVKNHFLASKVAMQLENLLINA